jgi:reverse transcriptase-like protein
MVSRRSIPTTYSYHRPLLSDVLPFEVPPTFSNAGFFDFLTRYNVRLERGVGGMHVVWECSSSRVDEAIELLFKTCAKHSLVRQLTRKERKFLGNPALRTSTRNGKALTERVWKLSDQAMRTRPYGFDIAHKEREFRRLSVIHPRNQIAVAHFYNKNSSQILYYAGLSDISIRYPAAVAKTVKFSDRLFSERKSQVAESIEQHSKEYENLGSFFSYKHFSNIFKFYEHYKYHNSEKKFDVLLRLDVSKCFDSIYTHSLPWSTLGTSAAKDHLDQSKQTFAGRFDRLLQEMNQGETNGIVIGPEFSRLFAEVILQKVDVNFLHAMSERHHYSHKSDFQAFRYVDDYFIFCSSDVDLYAVERELGVVLKEMKLNINAAKTEVLKKPIITDLTIAKNRVRQVFSNCIEIFESEVEHPHGSGIMVRKFTPKVRSNNLIVAFKSVLKETGVDYKNILNYSFAALERNVSNIFLKYDKTPIDIRYTRGLVQAIIGILEFAFFTYAADPRVNISIRLARLISIIVDQMNFTAVDRDSKHQVLKYIFDNINRQLKKSSSDHCPNIEVMYLILALRKLGREYLITEEVLAEYLGFRRDKDSGLYNATSNVDYFATTVCLCYITGKRNYSELRIALEDNILQRIQTRSAYVQNDAELLMTYFDIACCPYVSSATKMKIAGVFGHSVFQMWSLQASSPYWFTDWQGFDLSIALDKKRSREVY